MTDQSLGQVLGRAVISDFEPARPDQPPWVQPSGRPVEIAVTGNLCSVPLEVADRVRLHGLECRLAAADPMDMLPEDHTRQSWGVAPPRN